MTIPVILSTGSLFNFDVDTVMQLAAKTGFDGVELMVDWRRETHHLPHLRALMSRHNLPILAIHSPFTPMTMQDWPTDPIDSIKQSVGLAEAVGAQTVVVHPPGRWLRLQGLIATPLRASKLSLPLPLIGPGRLGQWLTKHLADFQATTPVKIAVENMPCRRFGPLQLEPHHFFNPAKLNRFQYLTLDTTHVGTRRVDLLQFYRQVEAKVAHIHLSNFNGHEHQLLHNGELPLAELLNRLSRQQFGGLVSLELGPRSLQANNDTRLKENLQNSLDFCRAALCQQEQPA